MNYICEVRKTEARQRHVFLMAAHKVTVKSIPQNFVKCITKDNDGTMRVIRHTVHNLQSFNPTKNKFFSTLSALYTLS